MNLDRLQDLGAASQPPVRGTGLSVVVPCYNEESTVRILHGRVTRSCMEATGGDYEIIFVNDGSGDSTWALLSALVREDSHAVAMDLSRNFGQQVALSAGLALSKGTRVLILDADLQDPPELLCDMMKLMDEGADVVYGQRRKRLGESWFKRGSAKVFYRLLRYLADVDIPVDTGDFRLMNRKVVDCLLAMPEKSRFIRGMVSWAGYRQVPLSYERADRHAGATKYPFHKMFSFAIEAIVGFSLKPIRLTIWLSAFTGLLALSFLTYALAGWLAGKTVPGWTSIVGSFLLLGAVQLLCLAILGEYIGRIFTQVKDRPLFFVREIRRASEDPRNTS